MHTAPSPSVSSDTSSLQPPRLRAAWHRLPLLYVALLGAGMLAGALVRPGGSGTIQYFDDVTRNWVLAHRTSAWISALSPVTFLGQIDTVIVLAAFAGLGFALFGRFRHALVPLVVALGTDVMVAFLKYTVNRPGPKGPFGEPAFPSGHTSAITALVVPLAVMAWTIKRWRWPAVLAGCLIAVMAADLLVLDAHWLTDILGGAVLTGLWAAAVALWLPQRRRMRAGSATP